VIAEQPETLSILAIDDVKVYQVVFSSTDANLKLLRIKLYYSRRNTQNLIYLVNTTPSIPMNKALFFEKSI
jgi:hypothetical protein